jgi:hypothetical protein
MSVKADERGGLCARYEKEEKHTKVLGGKMLSKETVWKT